MSQKLGRIIHASARTDVLAEIATFLKNLEKLEADIKARTKRTPFLPEQVWDAFEKELREVLNPDDFILLVADSKRSDDDDPKQLHEIFADMDKMLSNLQQLRMEKNAQLNKAQEMYDRLITEKRRQSQLAKKGLHVTSEKRAELNEQLDKLQAKITRLAPNYEKWSDFNKARDIIKKYQGMDPKFIDDLPKDAEQQIQFLYEPFRQHIRNIILRADPHDKRLQTVFLQLPSEPEDLVVLKEWLKFVKFFLPFNEPLINRSNAISNLVQILLHGPTKDKWKEAMSKAPVFVRDIKFPTTEAEVLKAKRSLLDIAQEDLVSTATIRADSLVQMWEKKQPAEEIAKKMNYSLLTTLSSNGHLDLILACWKHVRNEEKVNYLDCIKYPRSKSVFPQNISVKNYKLIPDWLELAATDVDRSKPLSEEVLYEKRLGNSIGEQHEKLLKKAQHFDYLNFLNNWQQHLMDWLQVLPWKREEGLLVDMSSNNPKAKEQQRAFKKMLHEPNIRSPVPNVLRSAIPDELKFATTPDDAWYELKTELQRETRKEAELYYFWRTLSDSTQEVEAKAHALLKEWNQGLRQIYNYFNENKMNVPGLRQLKDMCDYNLIYDYDLKEMWDQIPDEHKISIDPNHPWFRTANTPKQHRLRHLYIEYVSSQQKVLQENPEDSPMPDVDTPVVQVKNSPMPDVEARVEKLKGLVKVKFQFNLVDITTALKFLLNDETEKKQLELPEEPDEKNPGADVRDKEMIKWSIRVAEAIRDTILGAECNGVNGIRVDRNLRVPDALLRSLNKLQPTSRNLIVVDLATELSQNVESPWTLLRAGRWLQFKARVDESPPEPYIGARLPSVRSVDDPGLEAIRRLVKEYRSAPASEVWWQYFYERKSYKGDDKSEQFNPTDVETFMFLIRMLIDQKVPWDFEWFDHLQDFLHDVLHRNEFMSKLVMSRVFPEVWWRKKEDESPFAALLRAGKAALSKTHWTIDITQQYHEELRYATEQRKADITLLFNQEELCNTIGNLRGTLADLTERLAYLETNPPEMSAEDLQEAKQTTLAERDRVEKRHVELVSEAKQIYRDVDNLPMMQLRRRVDAFFEKLILKEETLLKLYAYWEYRPIRSRPAGPKGYMYERLEELIDRVESNDESLMNVLDIKAERKSSVAIDFKKRAKDLRIKAVAEQFWTEFVLEASTQTQESAESWLSKLFESERKVAELVAYKPYAPDFDNLTPFLHDKFIAKLDKVAGFRVNYRKHENLFPWTDFWKSFMLDWNLEMTSIQYYIDLSPNLDATAPLRYYAMQYLFVSVMLKNGQTQRIKEFLHIPIGNPRAQSIVMELADMLPRYPEFPGIYFPLKAGRYISEKCKRVIQQTKYPQAFGIIASVKALIKAIQDDDYYQCREILEYLPTKELLEFNDGKYYPQYKKHFLENSCFYALYDEKRPEPRYRPTQEEVHDVIEHWKQVPLKAIAYVCRFLQDERSIRGNIPHVNHGRGFVVLALVTSKGRNRLYENYMVTIENKQLHLVQRAGIELKDSHERNFLLKEFNELGPLQTWVSEPLYGEGSEGPCIREVAWTPHTIEEINRLL